MLHNGLFHCKLCWPFALQRKMEESESEVEAMKAEYTTFLAGKELALAESMQEVTKLQVSMHTIGANYRY